MGKDSRCVTNQITPDHIVKPDKCDRIRTEAEYFYTHLSCHESGKTKINAADDGKR